MVTEGAHGQETLEDLVPDVLLQPLGLCGSFVFFLVPKGVEYCIRSGCAKEFNRFQPILNVMNNLQPLPIELVNDTIIINETPRDVYSMVDIFTATTLLFEYSSLNITRFKI